MSSNTPQNRTSSPLLSFCIPTTGRATLLRLVDSILTSAAHEPAPVEILAAAPANCRIQLGSAGMVLPNPSGSAAGARNICAAQAKGAWLVFIDDDCYLEENYVPTLTAAIRAHSAFHALAGLVNRQKTSGAVDQAWLEAGFDHFFTLPQQFTLLRWSPSANLAVSKPAFLTVGGFADMGVPVGGEDVDFGMRLAALGLGPMLACPDLVVQHHALSDRSLPYLERKAYFFGRCEQALARLYPQFRIPDWPEPVGLSPLAESFRENFRRGRLAESSDPVSLSLTKMADFSYTPAGGISDSTGVKGAASIFPGAP